MPIEEPAQKRLLQRHFPILGWLPRYRCGDDLRCLEAHALISIDIDAGYREPE
jgi:hypothetical protein